jgi:hypothetical protein
VKRNDTHQEKFLALKLAMPCEGVVQAGPTISACEEEWRATNQCWPAIIATVERASHNTHPVPTPHILEQVWKWSAIT